MLHTKASRGPNSKFVKSRAFFSVSSPPPPWRKTLTPLSLLSPPIRPQFRTPPALGVPTALSPCRTCSRSSATSSSSSSAGKLLPLPVPPVRFNRRCSGVLMPLRVCVGWAGRWRGRTRWPGRQRSCYGRLCRSIGWVAAPTRRPRLPMPYALWGSSSSLPIPSVNAPTFVSLWCHAILL